MSRPSRSERSAANSRGRPKRRAAATNYLFKYQLASDPTRIEENALKKALQESLEEHKSTSPMTAGAAVIASKQTSRDKSKHTIRVSNGLTINLKTSRQQLHQQQQHGRVIMNSSTNSSDVSKTSNNSSSLTNTSSSRSEICRDTPSTNGKSARNNDVAPKKRLRSSATLPLTTPTPTKRAKLTTNGHIISSLSNNNDCDNDDTSVLIGSPVPPFNRSVQRTYSRSRQSDTTNGLPAPRQHQDVSPRTSTPMANGERATPDVKPNQKESIKPSVSRSTQTAAKSVVNRNKAPDESATNSADLVPASRTTSINNGNTSTDSAPNNNPPIQDHYHKFKRESKNYAYAKMTALQVNASKLLFSGAGRSSGSKKASPSALLSNNNTNKGSTRASPKGSSKTGSNHLGLEPPSNGQRSNVTKRTPSPAGTRAAKNNSSSNGFHAPQSAEKIIIPKLNLSAAPHGINNHTVDLSKNQNQANVNVMKKRIVQGSWSLLGVPEEKILYLRDDEPPRRLICYPAIKHVEGDVIQVRDSVLLRSGAKQTDLPYIAKVCAFWQDAETGGVMMSLFWYYRPEHTEDGRKPHQLIDEIFASRHRDVDSVECIEDKCYVLTFNEYCRYRKRCKMEQVNATWSLTDVTIPVSNESYPRRNRIPDSNVNPELVFCCRQIYDSRNRRLAKNPHINPKYGHI